MVQLMLFILLFGVMFFYNEGEENNHRFFFSGFTRLSQNGSSEDMRTFFFLRIQVSI